MHNIVDAFFEHITTRTIKIMLIGMAAGMLSMAGAKIAPYVSWAIQNTQVPKTLNMKTVDPMDDVAPLLGLAKRPEVYTNFEPSVSVRGEVDEALAYILVDIDRGQIIAQKQADAVLPIASLTKVMTAMVALDLAGPRELFLVSEQAAVQVPTKIGVVAGQRMTLVDLLHALLLTSANDAAQVIAEGINEKYGADIFIAAMNKKAQLLGLTNSHFANPQGFDDPENYSSAADLARLTQHALSEYPLIVDIAKKEYHFIPKTEDHKQFDLYNWNGLIGVYPDAYGLKIGSTQKAGKTTIVTSEREGKRLMAVVLGAPTILTRDLWAAELLDIGYRAMLDLPPVAVGPTRLKEKYASWKMWN